MNAGNFSDSQMTDSSFVDDQGLFDDFKEEDEFLTKLVDTIPAKFYFEHDIQERIAAEKHSVMDKTAADLKRKFNKLDLSAKSKHKRARLDPQFHKSVSEIQNDINKSKKVKKGKVLQNASVSLTRAANIEELQKRLHEKIKNLETLRKADKSTANKALKKNSTKNKKEKRNLKKVKDVNVVTMNNNKANKKLEKTSSGPVYNKEGNLIYSKFDFSEDGNAVHKKNKTKNPKKILEKIAQESEKIEKLKSSDPEKAELVIKKDKWMKAIQKSEGIKVKDDPALLKKTLKKVEKKKKKSAKEWKERLEQVQVKKKKRQEKRTRNIKAKKQEKFKQKMKRAKKKGRFIPNL